MEKEQKLTFSHNNVKSYIDISRYVFEAWHLLVTQIYKKKLTRIKLTPSSANNLTVGKLSSVSPIR